MKVKRDTKILKHRKSGGRKVKAKPVESIVSEQNVQFLERISDGFVVLNKEWHYTYVNQKAAELL